MRWSEADLKSVCSKLAQQSAAKPSKYRNQPTVVDGRRFASKKEANYYLQLKLAKALGQIRGFAHQVSLPLASGKRRMVIDFLRIDLDGTHHWVDTKGYATAEWKTKKDELEFSLGIHIEVI